MILSSEFSHFNFLCFLSAINFSLFFQKLLDIMEDKGIEVIEAHSITEEAFENVGEESIPENVSAKSALNKTLEKRTSSIDQTEENPSMIVKKQTLSIAILAELMIGLIACVQTLKMNHKMTKRQSKMMKQKGTKRELI